jgi:hypothetical protein
MRPYDSEIIFILGQGEAPALENLVAHRSMAIRNIVRTADLPALCKRL